MPVVLLWLACAASAGPMAAQGERGQAGDGSTTPSPDSAGPSATPAPGASPTPDPSASTVPLLEAAPPPEGGGTAPAGEGAAEPPLVTAPESPGVAASGDHERVVPQQDFVKGELSVFLGSDRVTTKKNRIGVSLGLDRIGDVYYLLLEPQVDLRLLDRKLAIGVGVPLHFQLVDLRKATSGVGDPLQGMWELRKVDYAQPADFAKLLKYVTYGRKEDHLYVNIGQRYASSVGHGAVVRRYAPNIDVDLTHVSAQVDAYGTYGGVELLTNDIVRWNVVSGLGFVKPLAFIDSLYTKSLSVGVTAAADTYAPMSLIYDNGARTLDTDGIHLAAKRGLVALYGLDAEVKVVKTPHVDIKPYVDYSMLQGGDAGLTVGLLGRFNAGKTTVHAFRAVAELKSLGSKYVPGYFGTFYEVDRYVSRVLPPVDGVEKYLTRYEDVMSGSRPQRLGYYLEGSWGIRGGIGVTVAAEGTSDTAAKNLVAHLEVPAVDFLQFFGSYYKRGFTDVSELGQIDNRSILFAGARLKILPILFVNGRAFKTFRMDTNVHRYENSFGFTIDVELGYEFDASSSPPPENTPAAN